MRGHPPHLRPRSMIQALLSNSVRRQEPRTRNKRVLRSSKSEGGRTRNRGSPPSAFRFRLSAFPLFRFSAFGFQFSVFQLFSSPSLHRSIAPSLHRSIAPSLIAHRSIAHRSIAHRSSLIAPSLIAHRSRCPCPVPPDFGNEGIGVCVDGIRKFRPLLSKPCYAELS